MNAGGMCKVLGDGAAPEHLCFLSYKTWINRHSVTALSSLTDIKIKAKSKKGNFHLSHTESRKG